MIAAPLDTFSDLIESNWRAQIWEPGRLPAHLKIDITVDDIQSGRPCDAQRCAMALAVSRALFILGIHFVAFSVTEHDIQINLNWRSVPVRYIHDAADLVRDFDNLEPVLPRTIDLRRLPR